MTLPTADLIAAAMVRALDTVPEVLPPPNEMSDKLLLEVIARRLRDAEEKLAAVTCWQPIATAPKDGTRILAWAEKYENVLVRDHPGPIFVVYYDGMWRARQHIYVEPTHWMPLPEPPPNFLASKEPGT